MGLPRWQPASSLTLPDTRAYSTIRHDGLHERRHEQCVREQHRLCTATDRTPCELRGDASVKKRKTTYSNRKIEIETLRAKVERLQQKPTQCESKISRASKALANELSRTRRSAYLITWASSRSARATSSRVQDVRDAVSLSTIAGGVHVESHAVLFAAFVEATDESPAFAINTINAVHQDDLHPYPVGHLRTERSHGCDHTLHEIPSPVDGAKPTISMARWSHTRLLPPPFPVTQAYQAAVRESMLDWCSLIPKVINERLLTIPPAWMPLAQISNPHQIVALVIPSVPSHFDPNNSPSPSTWECSVTFDLTEYGSYLARPESPMSEGPRKATYYVRRDEIEQLREQVRALEALLHTAAEERTSQEKARLIDSAARHVLYSRGIHQQHLQVATAQALLSSYNTIAQSSSASVPLKTFIHLPADAAQRGAILSALRERKLLDAFQFMAARASNHDLRVAHHQCEQSRLLNGDIVATVFSVVQFEGGHSVRQVYEAYQFFASNQEISVSDDLGVLTICENDVHGVEDVGGQMRFVSTPVEGLDIDSNYVRYTTCAEPTNDAPAYALGTLDFVDHDELYPYQPHRGRKDTTSAWLMVEVPSSTPHGRVVAMARWSHNRVTPPRGPLPKDVEAHVAASMMHWCDLMPKIMTEQLALQEPAP